MRIIIIVTQMEGGGAQRVAILSAREFRRRGHDVETWFLFRRHGVYDDEPMTKSLFPNDPGSIFDYLKIFYRLYKGLCQNRPERVLTFSHYSNIFGCFFAWCAGVKKRFARQTGLPQHSPLAARVLDLICGMIGIYSGNLINSQTTLSAYSNFPSIYRNRIQTVIDCVSIQPATRDKRHTRKQMGLKEDAFVLLSVSRLSDKKNLLILVEAISKFDGINLVIAGDGPERENLEKKISALNLKDRVFLLGSCSPDELGNIYNAVDGFVHPSVWESFGVAVLEAASAGLPLAISDIPALRENVGNRALYFDPEKIDEIRDAIEILFSNSTRRKELAENSRMIAAPFTVEAMVDSFLHAMEIPT